MTCCPDLCPRRFLHERDVWNDMRRRFICENWYFKEGLNAFQSRNWIIFVIRDNNESALSRFGLWKWKPFIQVRSDQSKLGSDYKDWIALIQVGIATFQFWIRFIQIWIEEGTHLGPLRRLVFCTLHLSGTSRLELMLCEPKRSGSTKRRSKYLARIHASLLLRSQFSVARSTTQSSGMFAS